MSMFRETALRELHEETGYGSGEKGAGKATVREVTPILVSDPGRKSILFDCPPLVRKLFD